MNIARTVKLSSKGQIVIPQEIREALQAAPGDRLVLLLQDHGVLLLSPSEYARRTRGLLKGTWGGTKETVDAYLQGERDAWR